MAMYNATQTLSWCSSCQGAVATHRPAGSRHPATVAAGGRMVWQAMFGYHLRTLVEACFSRYKHVIGSSGFHTNDRQQSEIDSAVLFQNRMLDLVGLQGLGTPHCRHQLS